MSQQTPSPSLRAERDHSRTSPEQYASANTDAVYQQLSQPQQDSPRELHGTPIEDESDRRSRFAFNPSTPREPPGLRERAASQPPRTEHTVGSLPQRRYDGMGDVNTWHQRYPIGRSPVSARALPIRSASFSTPHHDAPFGSPSTFSRNGRAFPSTFEDDEEEVSFDDSDPPYMPSTQRRGLTLDGTTRSRSQSLATISRPQYPASATLPAPGSSGLPQSWGDYGQHAGSQLRDFAPGQRYEYNGRPVHGSASVAVPISGHQRQNPADMTNMSPFVRDVGQILLDDGPFRELWGNMPHRDEGGGGSGTTSRRHSVSIVQPRRPVAIGFAADGPDDHLATPRDPFRPRGLMISDEDLASDLNVLNLNLSDSAPPLPRSAGFANHHPASLPIFSGPNSQSTFSNSPDAKSRGYMNLPISRPSPHVQQSSYSSSVHSGTSTSPHDGSPTSEQRELHRRPSGTALTDPHTIGSGTGGFRPNDRNRPPYLQTETSGPRTYWNNGASTSPTYSGQARIYGNSPMHSPMSPRTHLPYQSQSGLSGYQQPARQASDPNSSSLLDLGRGVPLHAMPSAAPLCIVEFKAGRTDLYYMPEPSMNVRKGDLVIVEADRGKDLGKVVNDNITLAEVDTYQRTNGRTTTIGEADAGGLSPTGIGRRDLNPKRVYGKATQQDTQLLISKMQDEAKALQLCQSKVKQKKLPMEVVDAEYQWDRRKLTFYFISEKRIDFRELVRELFRLYKTRIWMACLQGPTAME